MITEAKLLFDLIGPRSIGRFEARCEHPMLQQEMLLQRLLHENAQTEFGRRHRFEGIDSFSGFQKQVPLTEYEDLEPYIEASRRGEPAQLTRERPAFYATTSGTTGPRKYIPVTRSSRSAKARLMRVWLSALFRDHPAIFQGKALQVAAPEVEEYAPDGTPCGAEAGHAYRNMPRLMRGLYPVPYEICEIEDHEARYYTWLRLSMAHSVTVVGTPNPSTILLLARKMGEETERLVRDVRDGTLDRELELSAATREVLQDVLEPNPERALFLERAASAGGGRLLPRHVWPAMEVLACWKGGSVGPYLEQLKPFFREGLPVRDIGWLSSECRGSITFSEDGDSGPLTIATNVFEFFPADLEEEPGPTDLLTVDQLEIGGRYYVYVTTAGGLFRYAMHDILEVTGFHRRTPSVRFVQKGKGIVSFTGEKLTEEQVMAAAQDALRPEDTHAFFVAAVGQPLKQDSSPSYLFLVEYETPPAAGAASRTARHLDEALAKHNVEYASKRKSGRLGPTVLRVLEAGQFREFERRAIRAGARDGQFKILRLTDDSDFADHFKGVVADYTAA
jgi:GH3 auxin-responsive promoter